ncbi:hypothetical protein C3747_25g254 [Trypanosoma cruzi]|uniref:Uncharacterized protein n=2 Tax=Trypanosoma cruzi TaxID=5693 RepID=Q4CRU2_TRYCC|nr:hypothetical protein Tc00.1047053479517.30 [Trypanosoma cruzi]EAN82993.1 hypothetical protein Tc00.1047053479517.30 [Trypanosoma cruzi]PWV16144.1 hypothetical protein C3747_25g254 [Trypanosoma cruzi]RNC57810.1 hypothetical protein TcCL_ESM04542 [Trypanosoma cruzi]|eukprot:XP_804844.1 hypothetical protein [Trypanosoma cruzi strain CL Brener]
MVWRCLLRRCWTSRQDRDGGSSHGQRQATPMRTPGSWLLCHFTFRSILAQCGTRPLLYWMWMRLFTGSSFGGYARASFRCRVGFVDLVELTRPHTGHECCPEVSRTTARVLAEDPEMVRPQSVVPRVARRLLFGFGVSEPVGCGGVWFSGALVKSCEAIGASFSRETTSAALKHDASTRIDGGRVSPKACS